MPPRYPVTGEMPPQKKRIFCLQGGKKEIGDGDYAARKVPDDQA